MLAYDCSLEAVSAGGRVRFRQDQTPAEAIPSLHTINRDVMRYGGGISVITVFLYLGFYGYAALVLASMVVFGMWIGTLGYLFPRYGWYREWIAWVTTIDVATMLLMFITKSVWWVVVGPVCEVILRSAYEDEIFRLGREHKIPLEILQAENEPKGD